MFEGGNSFKAGFPIQSWHLRRRKDNKPATGDPRLKPN